MSVESASVIWQGSTKDIEFSYTDFKGNKTRRTVKVNKVLFDSENEIFYINGICQDKKAERDFKESNIATMIKVGSKRYDFQEWMLTLGVEITDILEGKISAEAAPKTQEDKLSFTAKIDEYNRKQQIKLDELKANHIDTPKKAKNSYHLMKALLWGGIFFAPYIFSWFTLRKNYSNKSKFIAFGWLSIFAIAYISAPEQNTTSVQSKPASVQTSLDASWPEKISAFSAHAKPYSIVDVYDYSFAGRKRIQWTIISAEANDYKTYLGTAIGAAKKLAIENRVNQATVFIAPTDKLVGLGYNLAKVTYTVDGKGNSGKNFDGKYWQAEAAKEPVSAQTIKITEMWYANRANFQTPDGITDEPKLIKFISNWAKVPESEVRLPWITTVNLDI